MLRLPKLDKKNECLVGTKGMNDPLVRKTLSGDPFLILVVKVGST